MDYRFTQHHPEVIQAINDLPMMLTSAKSRSSTMRALAYYAAKYTTLEDAIQQAAIGVIRAMRKFEPWRGFKFVTYAIYFIRAELQIGLGTGHKSTVIRTPKDGKLRFTNYEPGHEVDLTKLATTEDRESYDVSDSLTFFSGLVSEKDWKVLVERYRDGKTLREIGHDKGLTKERIRQIEKRALNRVRERDLFGVVG